MGKITFEFFEIVGAMLPGIPIFIMACFAVNGLHFSFESLVLGIKSLTASEAAIVSLICYCIGFCIHYPAYEIFQPLVKMWGKKRTLGLPISFGKQEDKLVRIRANNTDNFKLLTKFFALRIMAYSMFFSLLICIVALWVDLFFSNKTDAISAMVSCYIFGFLFLRRAVDFHWRAQLLIQESTKMIESNQAP